VPTGISVGLRLPAQVFDAYCHYLRAMTCSDAFSGACGNVLSLLGALMPTRPSPKNALMCVPTLCVCVCACRH
jgi:hypothetical protein